MPNHPTTILAETVETVTIEVPVSMLRRGQAACSEYSTYGSNDGEHELLVEFCDLVASAVDDRGPANWRLVVDLPDTPSQDDLAQIREHIPSELAESLTHDNVIDGRPNGIWFRVSGYIDGEPLGVAQLAASELLAAARRVQPRARLVAIDPTDT